MDGAELIEMRVADVRAGDPGAGKGGFIVVLEEIDGDRRLPIWIGPQEASALVFSLEKIELPRPLVYHFLRGAVEASGGRLTEVRIERLVEKTFYAVAVFDGPRGTIEVDARPSDALNLALLVDAPVRVRREVWEAGREKSEETLARLEEDFPLRGRDVVGRRRLVGELNRRPSGSNPSLASRRRATPT